MKVVAWAAAGRLTVMGSLLIRSDMAKMLSAGYGAFVSTMHGCEIGIVIVAT